MTDHLSPSVLNALADGELSAEQLAIANEHLAGCPACTSIALYQSLLKSATAKAGQRYAPPPHVQEQLMRMAAQEKSRFTKPEPRTATASSLHASPRFGTLGWATAAVLLLIFGGIMFLQRNSHRADVASAGHAAMYTEAFDQHIATLAGSLPPQVLSTDRHTVKPWFQGKIPFSFNLPEMLPAGTTLDGANLTYLQNQPVAQLMYSIGKHRVSVFVREKPSATDSNGATVDHAGFHVIDADTGELEMVAVSDVDPARLAELVSAIKKAQAGNHNQPAK
jgi:anti-sigma factor RsiW